MGCGASSRSGVSYKLGFDQDASLPEVPRRISEGDATTTSTMKPPTLSQEAKHKDPDLMNDKNAKVSPVSPGTTPSIFGDTSKNGDDEQTPAQIVTRSQGTIQVEVESKCGCAQISHQDLDHCRAAEKLDSNQITAPQAEMQPEVIARTPSTEPPPLSARSTSSLGERRGRRLPSLGSVNSKTSSQLDAVLHLIESVSFPPKRSLPQCCALPQSASKSSTGTQDEWASPSPTMLFLDYDDTLFPTSWLKEVGVLQNFKAPTDPEISAELEKLEKAACAVLTIACELSIKTCIISNSNSDWVIVSAKLFMPQLHVLLESSNGPAIIYARDRLLKKQSVGHSAIYGYCWYRSNFACEDEQAEILTNAKAMAMEVECKAFYSQHPHQSWKNLISIGDATYEGDALQEIAFMHSQSPQMKLRTKVIKLTTAPTPAEFDSQLWTLRTYMPAIVQFQNDLDVNFDDGEECLSDVLRFQDRKMVGKGLEGENVETPESTEDTSPTVTPLPEFGKELSLYTILSNSDQDDTSPGGSFELEVKSPVFPEKLVRKGSEKIC